MKISDLKNGEIGVILCGSKNGNFAQRIYDSVQILGFKKGYDIKKLSDINDIRIRRITNIEKFNIKNNIKKDSRFRNIIL